jgi:hypothetical protein
MEQDKQLKEILIKGSEMASADFTDAVMKRVASLSTTPFYDQPLVSSKLKKAFIFTFAGLVSLILLLCLLIGSLDLPYINQIEVPPLSRDTYYKILAFLFSFWVVFTANTFIEKNKFSFRRHLFL